MELTELEKAYIAGLLDGEGCFFLHKYISSRKRPNQFQFSVGVKLNMTHKETVEWYANKVGSTLVTCKRDYRRENAKLQWRAQLGPKKGIELCKLILPFLITKKEQAKVLIEYEKTLINNHFVGRVGKFFATSPEIYQKKLELAQQLEKLNGRSERLAQLSLSS